MILKIFTIHDCKAEAFIPPFTMPTTQMAIRSFSECANDPEHMFCKHATDYTLFQTATFDDRTGDVTPINPFENLGFAANFKYQEGEE